MTEGLSRRGRKTFVGTVVSDAMEKTIVVEVPRIARHAKYGKILHRSTRLYAHDEREEANRGDWVEVASTRPLSRLKRWRLVRVVRRGTGQALPDVAAATAVPGALAPSGRPPREAPSAGAGPREGRGEATASGSGLGGAAP